MLMRRFDVSDVESDLDRFNRLEAQLRAARTVAQRAFAQGFTAALEGENSREWFETYQEKADG